MHFEGSGRVARIVATAAARYLTPMTLEVCVDRPCCWQNTDDLLAARRYAMRIIPLRINPKLMLRKEPHYRRLQMRLQNRRQTDPVG